MTRSPARTALVAAVLGGLVAAPASAGAAPRVLEDLLPYEAPLEAPADALARVELPESVRARLAPDLSDLAVFDSGGRRVPHAVVWDSPAEPETVTRVSAEPLEAHRHTVWGAPRPPHYVETFVLSAPAASPPAGTWMLIVDADAPEVVREVRVTTPLEGGVQGLLAEATVFRLRAGEKMAVPLSPPPGARIEVRFEGEGGYLRPRLRFESSHAPEHAPCLVVDGADRPVVVRMGGGRLRPAPPSWDARLRRRLAQGALVEAGTLGPIRRSPRFDPTPALSDAHSPGRAVRAAAFTHRADLVVPPARDGVVRFSLPPSLLARARPDLADLRVVDEGDRQWPLRVVPSEETVTSPVEVGPARVDATGTAYALRSVAPELPVVGLRIELLRGVVEREAQLVATDASGRVITRPLHLSRAPGDDAILEVRFPEVRARSLELLVEDGDGGSLSLGRVEALSPGATVELLAPAGAYRALVGEPSATAPRYDVGRLVPLLDAVAGPVATLGTLEATPDHVAPPPDGDALARIALWVVLAAGFVLLGGLTLRLATPDRDPTPDP